MRVLVVGVLALLMLPGLVACGAPSGATEPLKVVATLPPLADWARQVGKTNVVVTQIVPAGVDPREYRLSERDRAAINAADVLIFNGLELEPWLLPAIGEAAAQRMIMLELAQFVGPTNAARSTIIRPPIDGNQSNDDARSSVALSAPEVYSQFLWLDPGPSMAQHAVLLIADTLIRADPEHITTYRRNAEQYNGELENLDGWIRRQVRSWPRFRSGRSNVLAVQALDRNWHYFALRYGITLRKTEDLQSFAPVLPMTTPLFVDDFVSNTELVRRVGMRQPDAVLKPLGSDSYVQLIRDNVSAMSAAMRRAERMEATRAKRLYEER